MIDVSIIIPTKNGGELFKNTLRMIFAQNYPDGEFEVIVIDSGSKDNTVDLANIYDARIINIKPEDFGHGKTRNLGAKLSKGKYLVFTTQDAVPVTENWLFNLVRNLDAPQVAGVYGRQIPKEDAKPMEQFFLRTRYPEYKAVKSLNQGKVNMDTIFFSNVNSAIRRDIFQSHLFPDDLLMSEDQEWAKRVILDGYEIVYEPEAVVQHSHNYSLKSVFQRYFDSGATLGKFARSEYRSHGFAGRGLDYVRREIRFLNQTGHRGWIPYALLYDFCKFLGVFIGKRERYMIGGLKNKLSLVRSVQKRK
jgi:rhamnosyltransferase